MRSPVPHQSTPSITLLRALRERRRNTPVELRHVDVIKETRISQSSLHQLGVLHKQILARPTHTRVLAAQCSHKNRRLAVVVKLVVDRSLRTNGTLVEPNGGEHGLVEAVFQDEAGVEGFAGDEEDDLSGTVVDVEGVETAWGKVSIRIFVLRASYMGDSHGFKYPMAMLSPVFKRTGKFVACAR